MILEMYIIIKKKGVFYLNLFKASDSMANYNISKYLKIKFQSWSFVLDNDSFYLNNEFNTRPCQL